MKKKIYIICLIIGSIFMTAGVVVWVSTYKAFCIYPSDNIGHLKIGPFELNRVAGISLPGQLSSLTDSAVVFDYDAGTDFSYDLKWVSGVEFNFNDDSIDAGGYKYMDITIRITDTAAGIISLITGERFSDTSHVKQPRYSEAKVQLKPDSKSTTYRIPFTSFESPFWWGAKIRHSVCNNLSNLKPDFSRIIAIRIYCDPDKQLIKPVRLQIDGIKFQKDHSGEKIAGSICFLAGIICGIMFMLHAFRPVKPGNQSPQPAIEHEDPREEMVERIKLFIEIQFSEWKKGTVRNAEEWKIKVEDVANGTAIKSADISRLLEWNGESGFRAYVNKLQIEEAKRLLIETEMQVGRIAEAVGYGHASNFNRVFKRIEKKQPAEFREEARKNRNG